MTTSTTENEQTTQATAATVEKSEAPKKANTRAQKPHVVPSKRRSGKKPTSSKKGAKARKQPGEGARQGSKTAGAVRQGSKTEQVLDLLKRSGGATMKELSEGHRLAAAFRPRLPFGHGRQEDGAGRHFDQG